MAKKTTTAKSSTSKAKGAKPAAKKTAPKKTESKSTEKKDNKKTVAKTSPKKSATPTASSKPSITLYKKDVLMEIKRLFKVEDVEAKDIMDESIVKSHFEKENQPSTAARDCKKQFKPNVDKTSKADQDKAEKANAENKAKADNKAKETKKDSAKKADKKPSSPKAKKDDGKVKQVGASPKDKTVEEGADIEFDLPKKEEEPKSVTVTAENVNDIIHGMGNPEIAANAGAISQNVSQTGIIQEGGAIPATAQPLEELAQNQPAVMTNENHQAHLQNAITSHGDTILGLIQEDFRMKRWGGMPFNMIQQVVNRGAKEYLYEVKNTEKGAYFEIIVGEDRYRFPKDENEFIPTV